MDRFAFLKGLTWLTYYGEEWPPKSSRQITASTSRNAAASSSSPGIILQDCSCCFHRNKHLVYFSTATEAQDTTQLNFEMAVVKMVTSQTDLANPSSEEGKVR